MTARAWTAAEQRDALRWRLELRMSLGEIAAALGRSEKSVEVALYRMGYSAASHREYDQLHARTALDVEIARAREEWDTAKPFKPGRIEWA